MTEMEAENILRVVGQCYLPNVGYDSLWNGSLWKGPGIWMFLDMKSYFSDFEIVSELTPSNETYYSIQTVHDNRADIILSFFGVSYKRYQFIDFPYAIDYATTYIISRASIDVSGEILEGVFDGVSYLLSFLVLICLTFILIASTLLVKGSNDTKALGNHLSDICLRCFSHITAQGFPNSFRAQGFSGQLAWGMLIMFCVIFQMMHSSIFISKLMAKVNRQRIDNLNDLEKVPDLKILLREDSYVENALNQLEYWSKFKSRVEHFGEYDVDYAGLLSKIQAGTHIMIEDVGNFQEFIIEANTEESCRFHSNQFQLSSERIFSLPSTFPMRKDLVHAEEINRRLMWIDAFGLAGQYDKNVNLLSQGIFSPVKMQEHCKLEVEMMLDSNGFCFKGKSLEKRERLGWKHFRITFTYLMVGLGLACVVFLLELFHSRKFPNIP